MLDTVRADRMSLYGYGRDTTPNLARLARRGVTFTQARSTAPWTLPSHASMMTGLWPHQQSARLHGPLDGTSYDARPVPRRATATPPPASSPTPPIVVPRPASPAALRITRTTTSLPQGILCTSALGRRLLWDGLVECEPVARPRPEGRTPQGRGADQRRPARLAQDIRASGPSSPS